MGYLKEKHQVTDGISTIIELADLNEQTDPREKHHNHSRSHHKMWHYTAQLCIVCAQYG